MQIVRHAPPGPETPGQAHGVAAQERTEGKPEVTADHLLQETARVPVVVREVVVGEDQLAHAEPMQPGHLFDDAIY